MRAPFQVLVHPYMILDDQSVRFMLFHRHDANYWQGIAGGGEDDEIPAQAALRELTEEAGFMSDPMRLRPLQACTMLPVSDVAGFLWGPTTLLIPEHAFAYELDREEMTPSLSAEHDDWRLCSLEDALRLAHWESNRIALWELAHRIAHDIWLDHTSSSLP